MWVEWGKNQGRKLVPRVSYQGNKPVPFEEYIPLLDKALKTFSFCNTSLVALGALKPPFNAAPTVSKCLALLAKGVGVKSTHTFF